MHKPKLLLLDEPANGLDPAGIVAIREILLELTHKEGVTVFISSHIQAEVARLAQRIGIIHQGRLLQELDMNELERNRRKRLLLHTRDVEAARLALVAAGEPVEILADGTIAVTSDSAVERPDEINRLLVLAGAPPLQLLVEKEELEAYFLRLVGMDGGHIGGAILAIMLANVAGLAGWGEYFPWGVPGLFAMAASPLTPASYWIVILTGLAGMIATYLWWTLADQSR